MDMTDAVTAFVQHGLPLQADPGENDTCYTVLFALMMESADLLATHKNKVQEHIAGLGRP